MHSRSEAPPEVQRRLANVPESAWVPVFVTEDTVISETVVEIDGKQVIARRTQYLADDLLQKANTQEFNESDGKRWGSGRVAARVPINKWLAEIAPRLRDGDRDYTKWWLNREQNRPFRTFKGKV